ncbi:MAG: DUF2096 family protein [Candidatus Thorarchaeota archaeon]
MYTVEGLRAAWAVLNELVGELEREGVFLPDLIRADLRNAKMVIEYLDSFADDIGASDSSDADLHAEIEQKVLSISKTVLSQAAEKDSEYQARWQQRFDDAIGGLLEVEKEEARVHVSDIPREEGVGFFRIRLPEDIPVEVVSEMAEACRVNISLDGERHLQVSGSKECVRDAMQRLGELFYGESKLR